MKALLTLLLALAGAVLLGMLLQQESGVVAFGVHGWVVEMSLPLFVLLLLALILLSYVGIRLLLRLWQGPRLLRRWREQRRRRRALRDLNRGYAALLRGRWRQAERLLIGSARDSEAPLLHYLGAAQAAQLAGDTARRDEYLRLAHEQLPDDALAVGLAQAELQLQQGQTEQALATLRRLQEAEPANPRLLSLLLQAESRSGEWQAVLDLLPGLKRHRLLDEAALREQERRAWEGRLAAAAAAGEEALAACWRDLPRRLQEDPDLLASYARLARGTSLEPQVERLLRKALKRNWSAQLVRLYGEVRGEDGMKQLIQAESWLGDHPEDPDLLLTLGRLSLENRLWTKAREYLEKAISRTPSVEAWRLLARAQEELGMPDAAAESRRAGLELAATGERASSALEQLQG
ncbi:MAG: heme biosynthesis protein HemY [Gammaproteobacteria bacterium]|nr:MAG: heme biosynthesis protein HemY [Gammaproteobacteria bacterium]